MNFSKRLQDLRKLNSMSQPELAKLINVSDRSISAWERGLTLPNAEIAIKLADFFNVSTDYLFGRDKETQDPQLDPNILSIQRAYTKLTTSDKEKMFDLNRLIFKTAFDEEEDTGECSI